MSKNKISVAIPAHNEAESIQRTLSSILASNIKNKKIEIVVCLSACTDNTEEKIQEFKKKHPKADIKVLESKTKGKVLAIKKLDDYIKNEIIVFMDADCSPLKDSIYMVYSDLLNSNINNKAVSGNSVDPRYVNKNEKPKNFTEVFNRAFWQRTGRKVINGPLYSIRKGIIQKIPNDIISEDTYLSIILWDHFTNNSEAKVIQGSSQTIYEYIRYQRNFQAAYKQLIDRLKDIPNFEKIFHDLTSQFDILLTNKNKYYPNISYFDLILVNIVIFIGKLWGRFIEPTWSHTSTSKQIAQ